jgi:hypothetical protein
MDVATSLHDLSDQRPNLGLSTLIKRSKTFLNIIYFGWDVFKWFIGFEKVLKWTPFAASMTYRTVECIRFLDTRFFPLSICSFSFNDVNTGWGS